MILNLALWFALHVLFRQMWDLRLVGTSLELPVLSSVNVVSGLLTLAAAVAAFRLRVGMISLLVASSAAGGLYYLLTGTAPAAH